MGAYIFGPDLIAARRALEFHRDEWRIEAIYDDQALRALHAPEHVHLAVSAMSGACFVDKPEPTFGEHGFSLDCPEARTLLWLSGPGIRRGATLRDPRVIDVAPTLACALGLSLPDAQGRALTEAFLG